VIVVAVVAVFAVVVVFAAAVVVVVVVAAAVVVVVFVVLVSFLSEARSIRAVGRWAVVVLVVWCMTSDWDHIVMCNMGSMVMMMTMMMMMMMIWWSRRRWVVDVVICHCIICVMGRGWHWAR